MIQTGFLSRQGGRSYNEDSVQIYSPNEHSHCVVLADGLGGHGGGDLASAAVCRTVCGQWNGEVSAYVVEQLLLQSHQAIHELQQNGGSMKSTGVVLLASPDKIAWGHVGDSRLYWFSNGKLMMQTSDHSASQLAVMMGQITQEEIRFHQDRSRLMKALGQDGEVAAETDETDLLSGKHCFLLCSDGFWEYVLEHEMMATLAVSANPQHWIEQMEAILLSRVTVENDNYSAAALWL